MTGSTDQIFTGATSPAAAVGEGDENFPATPNDANLIDDPDAQTYAVDSREADSLAADGTLIDPTLVEWATLSLSPISGTPDEMAALTISGRVTSDEDSGTPVSHWQLFYSNGWWDVAAELDPDPEGDTVTAVTSASFSTQDNGDISVSASPVGEPPSLPGDAVAVPARRVRWHRPGSPLPASVLTPRHRRRSRLWRLSRGGQ